MSYRLQNTTLYKDLLRNVERDKAQTSYVLTNTQPSQFNINISKIHIIILMYGKPLHQENFISPW